MVGVKIFLLDDLITIPPSVDGSIPILKDPIILEMLHLFGLRYPKFSNEVIGEYYNKPVQTLLHGDFHHGNHMYVVSWFCLFAESLNG